MRTLKSLQQKLKNPQKYLICLDMVKVVNLQGKLKSSKRQASELHFDFSINCIGNNFKILHQIKAEFTVLPHIDFCFFLLFALSFILVFFIIYHS